MHVLDYWQYTEMCIASTSGMHTPTCYDISAIPEILKLYLHIAFPNNYLSCVGILHQLLQCLWINVMQRHMGLPAL